jgi:hypothetical protein
MRYVLLLCAMVAGSAARADELGDLRQAVGRLERAVAQLETERASLARAYSDRADEVAKLKAQAGSFARDRKLQSLLAESRDMAVALDGRDASLARAVEQLAEARRALLASLDRELAAGRDAVAKERAELAARIGEARRLKVPDETIAPDDDAEDLAYKAGALAQAEAELRAEQQKLVRRVAELRRQARLVKSRARAEEQDVFDDSEPRHTGAKAGSTTADQAPPVGLPPTGTPGTVPGPADHLATPPADPAVRLADVVDAGTLDELRRAERTGEPEARAKAAERAARALAARAERLRLLRAEMERRARVLRGEAP